MYKCVHCQKEKRDCCCQTPFRTPDTPHDFPGQKRILRLMFDLPGWDEFMTRVKIAQSMAFMIDKALFLGDGSVRNHDAAEAKKKSFFAISSPSPSPYVRTKHRGSDEQD